MPLSSFEKIPQFLANRQPMTILELSKQLNLTKADIRYHLKKLIKLKIVYAQEPETVPPTCTQIRGRPARKYFVNSSTLPNNYTELLKIFLSQSDNPGATFAQLGDALLTDLQSNPGTTLIQKINELVKELNYRGYNARWETHPGGPTLMIENCPYRSLLNQFPGFCQMDEIIIQQTLAKKAEHTHSFLDYPHCRFQIKIFK
jgi:predicted ArsR family transcriptional regulator